MLGARELPLQQRHAAANIEPEAGMTEAPRQALPIPGGRAQVNVLVAAGAIRVALPVLAPDAIKKDPKSVISKPIGTGPYTLTSFTPDQSVEFTANPDYFGECPFVDSLVFKYVPDTTSFFTQFKTGEIDHTGIQQSGIGHLAER